MKMNWRSPWWKPSIPFDPFWGGTNKIHPSIKGPKAVSLLSTTWLKSRILALTFMLPQTPIQVCLFVNNFIFISFYEFLKTFFFQIHGFDNSHFFNAVGNPSIIFYIHLSIHTWWSFLACLILKRPSLLLSNHFFLPPFSFNVLPLQIVFPPLFPKSNLVSWTTKALSNFFPGPPTQAIKNKKLLR